ncbi:tumor necrosis factor receptor superfamily member 25-like isoform X2 [Manis javanica]|uniref:tumor necrosis factor receptor superfamily member 25-like isoform X2 n=1 Tax=Manis javanica TaxID=9974 RepID=UPI003C6D9E76
MAAGPVVLLLLLLVASVAVATSGTRCASDEYQNLGLCCKLCPAGHYLLQACSVNHTTGRCVRCEHGTFMSHPNREADCWPWTRCREDQEVVAAGSESSDQQCQCRSGRFYCDSEDCMESCFQCQRCDGLTLQACSATRNAVCATEVSPEPGSAGPWEWLVLSGALLIAVFLFLCLCGRKVVMWVVSWLKRRASEPGLASPRSSQPDEVLIPMNPMGDVPAPGSEAPPLEEEALALVPGAGTCPGPSGDTGESVEPQAVAATGSPAAPEQAPTALGLSILEQKYEQKYFLRNMPSDDIRIYYEFEHQVPECKWRMFMRFIGLDENEIEICERENPGNLLEQHHKMLLKWTQKLGRKTSIFKLMAVLHKMELHTCLQNIINKLIAENILVNCEETTN